MEQNLSDSRQSVPTSNPEVLKKLQGVVSFIGADWCGVQETIYPDQALLLFNNRKSHSTLAVKFNPLKPLDSAALASMQVEAADMLHESDAKFKNRKITVRSSDLDRIIKTASEVVAEVEELRRRK
jgi:hypothetical protein